jgi:hypothetical protein
MTTINNVLPGTTALPGSLPRLSMARGKGEFQQAT